MTSLHTAPSETAAPHRRIQVVIVVIVCRFAPRTLGAAVLLCMLRVLVVLRRLALHAGRLRTGSAGGELQAALLEVQTTSRRVGGCRGSTGPSAFLACLNSN